MKILAVDDDEITLEVLRETMDVAGFRDVTLATSANHAAEIIANAPMPFDCFCLDIQMPEVNGIDLCHWIRRLPNYRSTPIVMITAMSDKFYIDKAFAAGATDYVTKPFDTLELTTRMKLAAKLNAENRKVTNSILAIKALRAQIDQKSRVNLADPVSIEGIDGVIDLLALENYILQLSRGGKAVMAIIAFKIAEVTNLHLRCESTEFLDLLADVAEAISENLKSTNFFVSHAGNGTFVCVIDGLSTIAKEPEHLENAVRHTIESLELTFENGTPMNLEIHMSDPLRLGLLRSGTASVTMLYRAIAEVENICNTRKYMHTERRRATTFRFLKQLGLSS